MEEKAGLEGIVAVQGREGCACQGCCTSDPVICNVLFCDEDITKVDTHEPWPSASYESSSTWTLCSVRIKQTTLDGNGHNSLIRHPKETFFDALES